MMSTRLADARPLSSTPAWRELQAGTAGTLFSLALALTMGLLAFAALGPQAAALGIPAALIATVVGGTVFALLARGPMPAGEPLAAPVLVVGTLVVRIAADPSFSATHAADLAQLLALMAAAVVRMGLF